MRVFFGREKWSRKSYLVNFVFSVCLASFVCFVLFLSGGKLNLFLIVVRTLPWSVKTVESWQISAFPFVFSSCSNFPSFFLNIATEQSIRKSRPSSAGCRACMLVKVLDLPLKFPLLMMYRRLNNSTQARRWKQSFLAWRGCNHDFPALHLGPFSVQKPIHHRFLTDSSVSNCLELQSNKKEIKERRRKKVRF